MKQWNAETRGLLYGLLGIGGFSLTLPTTKIALTYLDPAVVGLGRAMVAAVLAGLLLWIRRERLPDRSQFFSLVLISLGVIVGFPFLSSWAMERVPASHGAIVIAILPLATAGAATLLAGERPSGRFWAASLCGSMVVLAYAFYSGAGHLQLADWALVGAVIAAAIGYAEGGKLARTLGGWQVISWALVLAFPFLLYPVLSRLTPQVWEAPLNVWLCFGYVSLVSQFLGFFAWYRGLALGGVARVSQVQYLQPFLTIIASALLLGEPITLISLLAATVVIFAVAQGRKAPVRISGQPSTEAEATIEPARDHTNPA